MKRLEAFPTGVPYWRSLPAFPTGVSYWGLLLGLVGEDPGLDLGGLHGSGLAGFFLAALEKDHGGDAGDAELSGGLWKILGVELGEDGFAGEGLRSLGELGSHHFAGSAPGGPKIDDDGEVAALDEFLEAGGIQVGRFAAR